MMTVFRVPIPTPVLSLLFQSLRSETEGWMEKEREKEGEKEGEKGRTRVLS
jgi:hypothetical protein